jgi:hypothetical protein
MKTGKVTSVNFCNTSWATIKFISGQVRLEGALFIISRGQPQPKYIAIATPPIISNNPEMTVSVVEQG